MKPANPVMRMSFSIYNNYISGLEDEAFRAIRGLKNTPSAAMERGKEWHSKWEEESKETGKVPKVFKLDIDVQEIEIKKTHELESWLVLSGVADALTEDSVIDYKTSASKTATDFINSGQLEIYCFLFDKKIGEILCYNHEDGSVSRARKHVSYKSINETLEKVSSVACEIRDKLEQDNLNWWRV